jgi:hypothetical protein
VVESVRRRFFEEMLRAHPSPIQANISKLRGIAAPCHEGQCIVEDQGEASAAEGQTGQFIQQHYT